MKIIKPEVTVKTFEELFDKLDGYQFDEITKADDEFAAAKRQCKLKADEEGRMGIIFTLFMAMAAIINISISILADNITGTATMRIFSTFTTFLVLLGCFYVPKFLDDRAPSKKIAQVYYDFDYQKYLEKTLSPDVLQWRFLVLKVADAINILNKQENLQYWLEEHANVRITKKYVAGINKHTLQDEVLDISILKPYINSEGVCDLSFLEYYVSAIELWLEQHPMPDIAQMAEMDKQEDDEIEWLNQAEAEIVQFSQGHQIQQQIEQVEQVDYRQAIHAFVVQHEADYKYDVVCKILGDIVMLLDEIHRENLSDHVAIYMDMLNKLIISYDDLMQTSVQSPVVEETKMSLISTMGQTKDVLLKVLQDHKESEAMHALAAANALEQKYVMDGLTCNGHTLSAGRMQACAM